MPPKYFGYFFSEMYFDVFGCFSQLKTCNVSVTASDAFAYAVFVVFFSPKEVPKRSREPKTHVHFLFRDLYLYPPTSPDWRYRVPFRLPRCPYDHMPYAICPCGPDRMIICPSAHLVRTIWLFKGTDHFIFDDFWWLSMTSKPPRDTYYTYWLTMVSRLRNEIR